MILRAGFRTALVSATTVALLGASVATAPAAPPPPPKAGFVDAPDVVPVGWTGPLTVAWLNYDEPQTFVVRVTGADGYAVDRELFIDEGSSVREPVDITAIPAVGDYTATFTDAEGTEVFDHDFRAAVPVALTVGDAAPATFLPRVRDGFRDDTRLSFTVDRDADVVGEVVDARGRVVQRVGLGVRGPGVEHRWVWFGRGPGGAVDRGTYTLRVAASADGLTSAQERSVRVASYRVPVTRKVRRLGTQTATRSPGDCRVGAAGRGALRIDCRGATRGARMTWRFTPGRGVSDVRWLVERDGPAALARRQARGSVVITARVRPGRVLTTRQVLVSYASRQQR